MEAPALSPTSDTAPQQLLRGLTANHAPDEEGLAAISPPISGEAGAIRGPVGRFGPGDRNRWLCQPPSRPTADRATSNGGARVPLRQGAQPEAGDLQHLGLALLDDRGAAKTLSADRSRVGAAGS